MSVVTPPVRPVPGLCSKWLVDLRWEFTPAVLDFGSFLETELGRSLRPAVCVNDQMHIATALRTRPPLAQIRLVELFRGCAQHSRAVRITQFAGCGRDCPVKFGRG